MRRLGRGTKTPTRVLTLALLATSLLASAQHAAAQETSIQKAEDGPSLADQVRALRREVEAQKVAADAAAVESITEATSEPRLTIYGYFDAGLNRMLKPRETPSFIYSNGGASFVSGHSNIYFDARPAPSWRGLLETRFSLYPHGLDDPSGPMGRQYDNRVFDETSPSGGNKVVWGSVITERAIIEWTHSEALKVVVGYFLTPYGIWNVDHGTPTLISLFLPFFISAEAMPARQTGIQLRGIIPLKMLSLGYHAYVSNGRTEGLFDHDDGKALGGRLFLRWQSNATITAGISGYASGVRNETKVFTVADGRAGFLPRVDAIGHEWTAAADLSVDMGALRLRTEGVIRRQHYDEGRHAPGAAPGTQAPNRFDNYLYILAAYRFRAFEPYIYQEGRYTSPQPASGSTSVISSVGVNIYFNPAVQWKTQYAQALFFDHGSQPEEVDFGYLTSRLVLAF